MHNDEWNICYYEKQTILMLTYFSPRSLICVMQKIITENFDFNILILFIFKDMLGFEMADSSKLPSDH